MAAPISNSASLKPGQQQARGVEMGRGQEALKKGQVKQEEAAPETGADTLTLSEAGRQLGRESGAEAMTPEAARNLVAQLKEKLEANPGFATAVHKASDTSRLATLLDQFA